MLWKVLIATLKRTPLSGEMEEPSHAKFAELSTQIHCYEYFREFIKIQTNNSIYENTRFECTYIETMTESVSWIWFGVY